MAEDKNTYKIAKKLADNFLDAMTQGTGHEAPGVHKKNMDKIAANPDFNPNIWNGDNVSMLSQSAIQGNLHAIKLLSDNFLTNLNAIHIGTGKTAISFGARNNRIDISLYLLKRHADPSIVDNKGNNTLQSAVRNISAPKADLAIFVTELLKNKKLDPLAKNNDGFNAYQLVNDPHIRHILLQNHRIKRWLDKETHKDAYIKKEKTVKKVTVYKLPEPGSSETALQYAIHNNHTELAEYLINKTSNDFNAVSKSYKKHYGQDNSNDCEEKYAPINRNDRFLR